MPTQFRKATATQVFDLTKSVREAWDWLLALRRFRDRLVFLVGTKTDLVTDWEKEDWAARHDIVASGLKDNRKLPVFEVSSRTGDGVSELMRAVVEAWTGRGRRKVAFEAPKWGLTGHEYLDIPVSRRHSVTAEEVIAAFLDVYPQIRGMGPGGVIIRRRSTMDEKWDPPLAHTAVIDLPPGHRVSATFRLDVRQLLRKGLCCEYYVAQRDVVVPVQVANPGMVTMLVRFLNEDDSEAVSMRVDRFDPRLLPIHGHQDLKAGNGFERPYGETQKKNWTWERYLAEQGRNAAAASCFTHGTDLFGDIESALALEEDARVLETLQSRKLLTLL